MTGENNQEREKLPRNFRIGILGALGSGKSTVAGLLHENNQGSFVIEERFGLNPYLAKFYKEPARWSYYSQTWFLLSKIEQYSQLKSSPFEILDPPLEMDRLYAFTQFQMGWMKLAEWNLYCNQFDTLVDVKEIKPPDIFFVIEAPEEILLKRIGERAKKPDRLFERWILRKYPEYPVRLARNVGHWVEKNVGAVPICTVDTGVYDCATETGRVQVAEMTNGFIRQVIREKSFLPS